MRDRSRAIALAVALAIVVAFPFAEGLTHRAAATQPQPAIGTLATGVRSQPLGPSSIEAIAVVAPNTTRERPSPAKLVHLRVGMAVKARPDGKARTIGV
ncbi:MAG TPA: hypothetical protein VH989_11765, partial [Actinomycetota bacterium]